MRSYSHGIVQKLFRSIWKLQPRWLRQTELDLVRRFIGHPLDPNRPVVSGNAVIGGFIGTASGLGKSARQMLDLFRVEGISVQSANASRFAVLEDFEAGPLWPAEATAGGPVIFHINPDIYPLIAAAIGYRRLRQRRVIGFWAWELEVLPKQWCRALSLVDEVWVPSRFIADAVRAADPNKTICVVPPFLDVAAIPTVPQNDPLPQFSGRPLVFFTYDMRSVQARKNPEGVIAAFLKATANNPLPVLVIKVGNAHVYPEGLAKLRRLAVHPSIHIMEEKLSDTAMRDLIARVDIVMSLHRSEGFGFLMAEAMAAAKPVIATGWSGNCDFMPADCTVLVDYKLVPVTDGQHCYDRYEARWADPDIDQAATALKRLLANPSECAIMGQAARSHIANCLSATQVMRSIPASFWQIVGYQPAN